MKNYYKYIILFFLFTLDTIAQITFNQTIDFSQNSEGVRAFHQLPDSSFILQGGYYDFDITPAGGVQSIFLMKVNQKGEMIWLKKYGEATAAYYTGVKSLTLTPTGGFAFGGTYEDVSGRVDYMLYNFDSRGDSIWKKTYGGEEVDAALQAKALKDGGFVLIGRSYSFTDNPEEDSDIYLIRISKDGNLLWANNYGETGEDFANTVEVMPDGGFIIGASIEKYIDGEKYDDGYLIRTDNRGGILWSKRFGEEERHCILSVKPTQDNGFLIKTCRLFEEQEDWITNYYISKTDSIGNVIWSYNTPIQSDYFVITDVEELLDESFIFCGYHLFAGEGNGHWGIIGKLSTEGELLWQKEYYTQENRQNLLRDIAPTFDGGFLASGTAHSPADTISNEEGRNIWLLKVNCEGDFEHSEVCTDIDVGIGEEAFLRQNSLSIFPNPTQDQVQFTWQPQLLATRLSIYNIAGQLEEEVELEKGQGVLSLAVADWESGVYFVVLEGKEGVLGREKLIINH